MGKTIVGGLPGGGGKNPCAVFLGDIYFYNKVSAEPSDYVPVSGWFSAPAGFDATGKTMKVFVANVANYGDSYVTGTSSETPKELVGFLNAAGGAEELKEGEDIYFTFYQSSHRFTHYIKLKGPLGVPVRGSSITSLGGVAAYTWYFSMQGKRWSSDAYCPYSVIPIRVEFYA